MMNVEVKVIIEYNNINEALDKLPSLLKRGAGGESIIE
jgi:adenylate cyclase class IV